MSARPGMTNNLLVLRRMTDTSETDTKINGVQYWTDDQLQEILDQHRAEFIDIQLIATSYMEAGVTVYKKYFVPDTVGKYVETDLFSIVDSLGNAAPANTVDHNAQLVTFTTSTGGKSYFIRGRKYDVKAAAAQVWLDKAAHRAELIKWKAGATSLDEDSVYLHCLDMYHKYSGFSGIRVVRLHRADYRWGVEGGT